MNILIVEDETLAYKKLEKMINKLIPDNNIVGIGKSIKQSVALINKNKIDLGFFDIQIQDGLSFDIFQQTKVNFPVIFTTAFNNYAIRAFKINSIDYLLKPFTVDDLQNAINKYNTIWKNNNTNINISVLDEVKQLIGGNYKKHFTVKIGNKIKIINTENICVFYSKNKASYAIDSNNSNSLIDYSLENIFSLLDPKCFFKISRKFIVNIKFIKDIYSYSNSRLKVNLECKTDEDLIVSREKVRLFKDWIENN